MIPKQREMDGIVKSIYEALESKDHLKSTLFVLCGDHGMNDAGNHGASSPGETSAALVFLSPKFKGILPKLTAPVPPENEFDYYSRVEQSDITPTIAALLGFPVSRNNLGAFIPSFLSFWPAPRDQIQILIRNARQILSIVKATFGSELFEGGAGTNPCAQETNEISALACDWRRLKNEADSMLGASEMDSTWLSAMATWLRKAQDLMSSMASNYDIPKLVLGQGLALVAVLCSVMSIARFDPNNIGNVLPLAIITMSYGGMMFASSYVEEEQHFWYWSSTIWVAYLALGAIQR
jgi:ethanolaminephosphotransferase